MCNTVGMLVNTIDLSYRRLYNAPIGTEWLNQ